MARGYVQFVYDKKNISVPRTLRDWHSSENKQRFSEGLGFEVLVELEGTYSQYDMYIVMTG